VNDNELNQQHSKAMLRQIKRFCKLETTLQVKLCLLDNNLSKVWRLDWFARLHYYSTSCSRTSVLFLLLISTNIDSYSLQTLRSPWFLRYSNHYSACVVDSFEFSFLTMMNNSTIETNTLKCSNIRDNSTIAITQISGGFTMPLVLNRLPFYVPL
jgi:hypothetical protein